MFTIEKSKPIHSREISQCIFARIMPLFNLDVFHYPAPACGALVRILRYSVSVIHPHIHLSMAAAGKVDLNVLQRQ